MKIEKGKFYKTRNGRKVEILKTDAKNPYPIVGSITRSDGIELSASWCDNGTYLKYAEHANDIIDELEEALDFDPYCLPKWADKWIAMDADGDWYSYSIEPTRDDWNLVWSNELGDELSDMPVSFSPKNYKGDWKDSLFNVTQLKKDKKCQYK